MATTFFGLQNLPRPVPARRVVLPREHGAIAQLLVPLACALGFGPLQLASVGLSLAAVAGLLGHEPLMVLLGHRGLRPQSQHRLLAQRLVGGCAVIAAGGVALAAVALRGELLFLFVPALLSLVLLGLALPKREHSTRAEALAAAALSSWSIPLARLGGAQPASAWLLGGGFALAFALATVAVRAVIASHKRIPKLGTQRAAVAFALASAAALRALSANGMVPFGFEAALWPMEIFALGTTLGDIHPRQMVRLGFANLGVSMLVAALLFHALHG
jgi:hypothetical protein